MSMSSNVVTRVSKSFVTPSEPTPNETLTLSFIDRVPGLRHGVRSIHVFKHGHEPAKVIKEALSKALVYYYPFAGRFTDPDSPSGELTVACTGEGAYFIEATANCHLEDVNYLDLPLMIPEHHLLPDSDHPNIVQPLNIPLMMQVTEFRCGGFAIGLITIHSIADGLGSAQFINAIAELARGLEKPTVKPIRDPEMIPSPPKLPSCPPPTVEDLKLKHSTFDISRDFINDIKTKYLNKMGNYCFTFDVSLAKAWQARTRAAMIKLEDDDDDDMINVHLCFFANTRQYLNQRMEAETSYYGNCFYPVTVSAARGTVANAELVELVKLIKEAKKRLGSEFAEWGSGAMKKNPYEELSFTYNWLFVSDWTKLGFQEVDYGWGNPLHVIPFAYSDAMPVAILASPPAPANGGSRLMTQCVKEPHLGDFVKEMAN